MKRIIVCDSGLGGLNIARRMCANKNSGGKECELIFFNAYPAAGMGFNKITSPEKQEKLLTEVLESMKKFAPASCVIACNTLSIIYERAARNYTPPFPVSGIIDTAVNAMYDALNRDPESSLLILGTRTTVESGCYAEKLIDRGIDRRRINGLACPGVATLLESDPSSAEIAAVIAGFAASAPEMAGKRLYLALCCTHFEFAGNLWLEKFSEVYPEKELHIINPNEFAAGAYAPQKCRYLSRIDFFPGAKEAMGRYFSGSAISEALAHAEIDGDLFDFEPEYYL